jgi:large-conductance mechanosensitive channel
MGLFFLFLFLCFIVFLGIASVSADEREKARRIQTPPPAPEPAPTIISEILQRDGQQQPAENISRAATFAIIAFSAIFLLFLAIAFSSADSPTHATVQNSDAADGQRAGTALGFANGKTDGQAAGYGDRIRELYDADKYRTDEVRAIFYVGGAFAIGFGAQYALFYLVRRIGLVHDIDLFLLPQEAGNESESPQAG